jgi:predicted nuclease of restriction endonuclease-like (RecB) superfamily
MSKLIKGDAVYTEWLTNLKQRIRSSQIKAAVRVNNELIELYWSIGADIVDKQIESTWGDGVIPQLSKDLKDEFPDAAGYSVRNLKYMRQFYQFYSTTAIGQQVVAQLDDTSLVGNNSAFPTSCTLIPWGHNIQIFTKSKSRDEALFYVQQTIENGWSRAILMNFMSANLYKAKSNVPNNFPVQLPEPQSDLAAEILKDPYNFDFITLTKGYKEKELEDALTANITKFLLELGQGFAYVGRQFPLNVGGDEFALDLLFYHLKLRCYVAIELKAGKFSPKDLGQLGFYVTTINHQYKTETDNPTLGILVCKEKNNAVAKYALGSSSQPLGISEYDLTEVIPDDYKSSLPTIEEIEEEFKDMEFPEK